MSRGVTISIVIGIVIIGILASFSIYLQLDKAEIEISRGINPHYHCLQDYEYIDVTSKELPETMENKQQYQSAFTKFYTQDYCHHSFREWLPKTHSSWGYFENLENNRKNTCKNYLNGLGVFEESDISNLKLWECKDLLN